MSKHEGRLSGKRWNRILDHGLTRFQEMRDHLTDQMLADGHPPFSVPLTPAEQFQRLLAWQSSNDPRYWQDPAAQQTFARLAMRFGADVPALPTMPAGQPAYPGGGIV